MDVGEEMKANDDGKINEKLKVGKANTFRMYLGTKGWYSLTPKEKVAGAVKGDVVKSLDTCILTDYCLSPILGIKNLRKDKNIGFVGGIRGLASLQRRIDGYKDGLGVAFGLFPTSLDQLMNIADAGAIMPPKSTWFEPKLRSGMVVRSIDS